MAAAPFALAPGLVNNDPVDYGTSEGAKLFKTFTAELPVEFDCSTSKLKVFLSALADRAGISGWDEILEIPPDLAVPATTRNLLTEYGRLTLAQVTDFVGTFNQNQDRNAQASYAMYHCIMKSLTESARLKTLLREDEFTVNGIRAGPCLLKVVITLSYLDSNATTKLIREQISNLDEYMVKVDSNIEKFNYHVRDLTDSLTARGEETQDLLANLFKGYAAASDEKFVQYIEMKEAEYDEGTNYTSAQLMDLAINKYNTLLQKGKWNASSDDHKKIVALEALVDKLSKKVSSKPKKDDGGSEKKAKSKNKKGKPKPEWMTKPPSGASKTKTVDGKVYHWCPNHNAWVRHAPEDCKGVGTKKESSENQSDKKNDPTNKALKISKALATVVENSDDE